MRLVLLLCFLHLFSPGLLAQWGLRVGYGAGQSAQLAQRSIRDSGPYGIAEYTFRLKQNRLEFHPGIGYRHVPGAGGSTGRLSALLLEVQAAAYPFDFRGDCHCPTFSKQGDILKKGFFLAVSSGIALQSLKRTIIPPGMSVPEAITDSQRSWTLGLSAGLDLGISERFTLTPFVAYAWYLPTTFRTDGMDRIPWTLSDQRQAGIGLRLTCHLPDRMRR